MNNNYNQNTNQDERSNNNARQGNSNLTTGSVTKKLLMFVLPFLVANVFQAAYGIADYAIVSFYSGIANINAVNSGMMIMTVVTNLIVGFSVGGTVTIAQYFGGKNPDQIKLTISTIMILFSLASVVLMTAILVFARPIIDLINVPTESVEYTYQYLTVCAMGIPFIFLYNAVSCVLRGLGNSRAPLIIVSVAAVTNVVLDLILVSNGYGALGAAIATIISQGLAFTMAIFVLTRQKQYFSIRKIGRVDTPNAKKVTKIGLPVAVQQLAIQLSFVILLSMANGDGDIAAAAYGVVTKISTFMILPAAAMMGAISAMVGQNLGAGM